MPGRKIRQPGLVVVVVEVDERREEEEAEVQQEPTGKKELEQPERTLEEPELVVAEGRTVEEPVVDIRAAEEAGKELAEEEEAGTGFAAAGMLALVEEAAGIEVVDTGVVEAEEAVEEVDKPAEELAGIVVVVDTIHLPADNRLVAGRIE